MVGQLHPAGEAECGQSRANRARLRANRPCIARSRTQRPRAATARRARGHAPPRTRCQRARTPETRAPDSTALLDPDHQPSRESATPRRRLTRRRPLPRARRSPSSAPVARCRPRVERQARRERGRARCDLGPDGPRSLSRLAATGPCDRARKPGPATGPGNRGPRPGPATGARDPAPRLAAMTIGKSGTCGMMPQEDRSRALNFAR